MTKRLIVKNLTSKRLSGDIILTNKVLKLQLTKNKTPLTHFRFSDEPGIIGLTFWTVISFQKFRKIFSNQPDHRIFGEFLEIPTTFVQFWEYILKF